MSSALPSTFGRYTLQKRIATGGMAEIFLAKQQGPGRFERSLVIKRILPHLAEDERFTAMFLDEAALAAQLSHPHIATVHDFGQEEGSYYIAMELVRGPDLRRVVTACRELRRPMPVPIAVRVITQVLAALDHAHRATNERGEPLHVVHRDVSPQNVLVSAEGVVKLVDFGIAKAADASHHTDAGVVKGKFAYLAPEQLAGVPVDGRCDLFSAALVLYELLTLERAYAGEGPALLRKVMEGQLQPIEAHRPELPPALIELVGRALQKDPAGRPPDCRSFQRELEQLLVKLGATVTQEEVAGFLRTLEIDWGKPLSALGDEASGPKIVEPAPAPPEKDTLRDRPRNVAEEQKQPAPAPSEKDTLRDRPPRDPNSAPASNELPRAETGRIARPMEPSPVPLVVKRPSLARMPLLPETGPVGRSTLIASAAEPAHRGPSLWLGILAALILAAGSFFAVRYVFGAHAAPAAPSAPAVP